MHSTVLNSARNPMLICFVKYTKILLWLLKQSLIVKFDSALGFCTVICHFKLCTRALKLIIQCR